MHKKEIYIACFIFILVTIFFMLPILKNISYWGQMDWDQFTFWNAVPREIILKYHQFPLWNFYSNGGNVMLAHPHSSFLSPFFLFVLFLGAVVGLKINWILHLFLGMLGAFFLCRYLKMSKISQYLPSLIFMLSTIFTLHLSEGHAEWMDMAFLPWFFLFFLKANLCKNYIFLSAFFLSLMVLWGSINILSITIIYIFIYSLCISLKEKKRKYILTVSKVFLFTFLLCSVKLIPMLEFIKENPRKVTYYDEKIDIALLHNIFLSPEQFQLYQNTKWTNPKQKVKFRGREFEYGWHEYGAYIGYIPLILAILGLFFYFKQYWPLFITGIISLWISLGKGAFCNLWELLHKFPIYDSLQVPSRFLLGFLFSVSIISGFGLSKIENIIDKKYHNFLIVIIAFVFFDLFLVNYPILKNTFTLAPPKINKYIEFKQRYRDFNLFPGQSRSSMYPVALSNNGIINSYEVIALKKGEVKVAEDDGYKGEIYLSDNDGEVNIVKYTPTYIQAMVNVTRPTILVVNQNYFNGWKVMIDGYRQIVKPYKGLISADIMPGYHKVKFYYLPNSFVIGFIISLLAFIIIISIVFKYY